MAKIVVYGGSGGIGTATARLLHQRGYDLHLVGRDVNRLAATAAELGAAFTVGDVTDDTVFARVAAEAGAPLAGLAYAVGTITLKPLSRLTSTDFAHDFRINAEGAALAIQALLPAFKAFGEPASVLLFSSVAVGQGFSAHASISMAKGAVEGLTRALAAELAPKVRVNAIAPSLTRTPLAQALTENAQVAEAIADLHALGRLGMPQDVAALAAFLLSRDADWITGQVIGVDGGRAALRTKG
ncbi:MAG: SDR family oxidoreductase [Pseudomonadota bacterium]